VAGNLVLGSNGDSGSVLAGARAWMDNAPGNVVAVQGSTAPALITTNCDSLGGWTPLWLSCYSAMAPTSFSQQGAFLMAVKPNSDGGHWTNLKGRMNFLDTGDRTRAHHYAVRFQFPKDRRHRKQPSYK
jgi:hypothetical protein